MKHKSLLIICMIICLFSIASVCASDVNDTIVANENMAVEGDSGDIGDNLIGVDEEYNAEIWVYNIVSGDNFADAYVKVYDKQRNPVVDANLCMNNKTADNIDVINNDYHFYIFNDGNYEFTLDDGVYKATHISFEINGISEVINKNNTPSQTSTIKKNLTFVSKNVTIYYDDMTAEVVVWALDDKGNHIQGLNLLMNNKTKPDYDDKDGYQFLLEYLPVGTHKVQITLEDDKYAAEPIDVYVKVLKSTPKLTAKKWYSTQNQYVTLRAIVSCLDDSGWIDEGTVTFKINGKSYTVKVDGGDAIKKVKIKKPGTYTYSVTFKNKNHYTKTIKQKVYVYSTSKKARTFNIGGYKAVISVKQLQKLVNAKNTNKGVSFDVYTNKYVKQKYRVYKTTYKWKYMGKVSPETAHQKGWKTKNYVKHWVSDGEYYYTCDAYKKVLVTKVIYKTVKARGIFVFAYGGKNGLQTAPPNKYTLYLYTRYQYPDSFCTPNISKTKKSSEINKLNKAKAK